MVELLLNAGADRNVEAAEGKRPVDVAAKDLLPLLGGRMGDGGWGKLPGGGGTREGRRRLPFALLCKQERGTCCERLPLPAPTFYPLAHRMFASPGDSFPPSPPTSLCKHKSGVSTWVALPRLERKGWSRRFVRRPLDRRSETGAVAGQVCRQDCIRAPCVKMRSNLLCLHAPTPSNPLLPPPPPPEATRLSSSLSTPLPSSSLFSLVGGIYTYLTSRSPSPRLPNLAPTPGKLLALHLGCIRGMTRSPFGAWPLFVEGWVEE